MSLYIIIFFLLIVIILLISQIKKLHYFLKKSTSVNELLYKINNHTDLMDDITHIYNLVLIELIFILNKNYKGCILIYNNKSKLLEYQACIGYNLKILKSISFSVDEFKPLTKNKLSYSCIIENPLKNFDYFKNIKSTLYIPIYIDNAIWGIITIDSPSIYNNFSITDFKIADYIKKQIEQSIKTMNLINTLNQYANYDYLTGAINRRSFEEKFKNIKCKNKCILALIDLNNFKSINDTYGHSEGDLVLQKFSETVKNHIRKNDLFARIGGDEFLILFRNIDKKTALYRISEIRKKLKNIISFSIGLEEICLIKNSNLEDILKILDKKMYKDKRNKFN